MLAISLNRVLIASQALVHVLVFGGAIYLAWRGYRTGDLNRKAFKRFAIVAAVVAAGFLFVWAWHLM
jgi:threonine/homoserine/homoserine lactone efflux protein